MKLKKFLRRQTLARNLLLAVVVASVALVGVRLNHSSSAATASYGFYVLPPNGNYHIGDQPTFSVHLTTSPATKWNSATVTAFFSSNFKYVSLTPGQHMTGGANWSTSPNSVTITVHRSNPSASADLVIFSVKLKAVAPGTAYLQLGGPSISPGMSGPNVSNGSYSITDVTNPTASITSPANGATVSSAASAVSIKATDNVAVSKVELYIDGKRYGQPDSSPPYAFNWNTTLYATGNHTLHPKAYDSSNRASSGGDVVVKVNNTSAAPNPPAPGPSPGSGGSSPSGSKPKAPSGSGSSAAPQLPSAPTDFSATVQADKVIELSWNASAASAGIQTYSIDRSLDNSNWTPLTATSDTAYEDNDTEFGTTYYYRIQAIDNNNNTSDFATTQVTTGTFSNTSNRITSADKLLTIEIPDGAFDGSADCSVSTTSDGLPSLPNKQTLLVGAYDLICVDSEGTIIDSFNKPLKLTMNLSDAAKGYTDVTARAVSDNGWETIKGTYDAKSKKLSFELTDARTVAAFGVRHKSPWGTILSIFLILALMVGGYFGYRWWRGRSGGSGLGGLGIGSTASSASADANNPTAQQQFEQAVAKPNCTHLSMAQQVEPQSEGCQECQAEGKQWKALRVCLVCGHVGCSDDSPEQHALKHFQQTGHPLILAYGDPAAGNIGWCYIDQTYI